MGCPSTERGARSKGKALWVSCDLISYAGGLQSLALPVLVLIRSSYLTGARAEVGAGLVLLLLIWCSYEFILGLLLCRLLVTNGGLCRPATSCAKKPVHVQGESRTGLGTLS